MLNKRYMFISSCVVNSLYTKCHHYSFNTVYTLYRAHYRNKLYVKLVICNVLGKLFFY